MPTLHNFNNTDEIAKEALRILNEEPSAVMNTFNLGFGMTSNMPCYACMLRTKEKGIYIGLFIKQPLDFNGNPGDEVYSAAVFTEDEIKGQIEELDKYLPGDFNRGFAIIRFIARGHDEIKLAESLDEYYYD